MLIPDIIRSIATFISSPLDLYAFSLVTKITKQSLEISPHKQIARMLLQGRIAYQIKKMKGLNKVLLGESRTGKSHVIMYYILDYWRRTRKSVLVVLRGDKIRGWIERAKVIFGDELPIFIWSKKRNDKNDYSRFLKDSSIAVGLNKGVCICESSYPGKYYFAEEIFHYNSLYYTIPSLPSYYTLVVVDEESDIGKYFNDREVIFVRRPSLLLTTRNRRMKKSIKIELNHSTRCFSLPSPVYHSKIIQLPHVNPSIGPENIILDLLKQYQKILVIMHTRYETAYYRQLKSHGIESHHMRWRCHAKK